MALRTMPAAKRERVLLPGPAGDIETDIDDPGPERRGIALIAHPNPVQGGTKDNKVVTTVAKACYNLGYVALRPNFRGVGASGGAHDGGIGETEDLLAVARQAFERYGELPLLLGGFSFGAYVQTRVAKRLEPARMVLVGAAVNRFQAQTVPSHTLIIHGEQDAVVPLAAVLDWARPQRLPVVVVPGAEHFFHGRLDILGGILLAYLR